MHTLNGKTNSKVLKKDKAGSWEYTYTSTARTVLRTLWLIDFLHIFFSLIVTKPDQALSTNAREAYDQAFGAHHEWVVRQGAKVAMYAMPTKEVLMVSTGIKEESHLATIVEGSDRIRLELWRYYKLKGLDTLP